MVSTVLEMCGAQALLWPCLCGAQDIFDVERPACFTHGWLCASAPVSVCCCGLLMPCADHSSTSVCKCVIDLLDV